jgi:hypothetical protein
VRVTLLNIQKWLIRDFLLSKRVYGTLAFFKPLHPVRILVHLHFQCLPPARGLHTRKTNSHEQKPSQKPFSPCEAFLSG